MEKFSGKDLLQKQACFQHKKKSPAATNPACHFLYYSLEASPSPCGTEASTLTKIHCFLAKWTHLGNLLFLHDETFNLPCHLIDRMKKKGALKHSTDVPSCRAPLPQITHLLHQRDGGTHVWCNKDKTKCSFTMFCKILQDNLWLQLLCLDSELYLRKTQKKKNSIWAGSF